MKLYSQIKNQFKRKFVSDVVVNFGSLGFIGVSGIFLNIIIAKAYNSTGLGLFSATFAIYSIISIFSTFGINDSVLKHTAEKTNDLSVVYSSAIMICFSISLTVLLISMFVISLLPKELLDVKDYLLIILWGVPWFSTNKVMLGFINGIRQLKTFAIIQTIRWLLIISGLIILFYIKTSLSYVFYIFPITEFILFFTIFFITRKNISLKSISFFWIKKHFHFGKKIVATSLSRDAFDYVDIIVLSMFCSNAQVGTYSFAATIAKKLLLISSVIQRNFNPIISELITSNNTDKLLYYIKKIKRASLAFTILIFPLVAIGFPFFILYFMQSEFLVSIPIFFVLLSGIFFFFLFHWAANILTMGGFPEKQFKIISFALLFNIIGNIVITPYLNGLGAAISSSISFLLIVFLNRFCIKKVFSISIF